MRRLELILAVSVTLLLVGNADAGWKEYWRRAKLDFHRQQAWPHPFVDVDRQATRAPFEIMVNNGWQANNTLTQELFDPATQKLNHAGLLKVRWIATQAPLHRRVIYVLRGSNQEVTEFRVASVQDALDQMIVQGNPAQVAVTSRQPAAVPGYSVHEVERKMRAAVPSPVLPEMVSDQ